MSSAVSYEHASGVSTISMDDGKVNAMSIALMGEINSALDQAERDEGVVVLTGKAGVFSAGFDLSVFKQGHEPTMEMLRVGARLNERVLSYPFPVLAACTGHGIAMGSFLLMCADYRIGVDGPFKIGMNEVAIGMTLPYFAIEIARHRLPPAYLHRATVLGELYSPKDAIPPGFLDRVVAPEELLPTANQAAIQLGALDMKAHRETKLRVRRTLLDGFRHMVDAELGS
ncbi:MAG: crotonase/enoyl-CoA hydratase family protein [Polyangiales bacterium]